MRVRNWVTKYTERGRSSCRWKCPAVNHLNIKVWRGIMLLLVEGFGVCGGIEGEEIMEKLAEK